MAKDMKGFIQGSSTLHISPADRSGLLRWTAPQPVVWYLSEAYLPAWRWQDSPLTIFNYVFFFPIPTRIPGTASTPGHSSLKTPSSKQQCSSAYSSSRPTFSHVLEKPHKFHLSITCFKKVKGSGMQLTTIFSRQCAVTRAMQMPGDPTLPPPSLGRRYQSHRDTRFTCHHHSVSPVIWLLNTCPSLATPV